ncbi:glycosyltransferase [bacterium]|nr:glycosyltransferase [bacterium]
MNNLLLIVPYALDLKGGIETYNKLLIQIINENYPNTNIDILVCNYYENKFKTNYFCSQYNYYFIDVKKPLLGTNKFNIGINRIHLLYSSRRLFNKLIKSKKYDLILNSTQINFPKSKKKENFFLIQHLSIEQYVKSKYIKSIIQKFFLKLLNHNNLIKYSKNIVVYDKYNKEEFIKYNEKINYFVIPLTVKESLNKNDIISSIEKRKKIVYFGRININQKNVDKLYELNKTLECIDFYGESYSEEENILKQKLINQNSYNGIFSDKTRMLSILNKYKFCILYSNYEGFGFSLVEALSVGLPLIVKNSYTSASFLCNDKTGLLLPKDTTIDQDIKLIIEFINMSNKKYTNLVFNCLDFFYKNLSFDIFKDR